VVTEQVSAHAMALDGFDAGLRDAGLRISGVANAAAETPAEGALLDATAAWERTIGAYAGAVHQLAIALALAAQCYAVTDGSVVRHG